MQSGGAPTSDLERQGTVVGGKFRLESLVGRGGMGSVWKATHLGLGRTVAIKLVSRDLVRSREALRRFDAEAKSAARLQSRHVVQVFDNGVLEDGTPYIAMELLEGQNLLQRLQADRVIPLDETVHILAGAAKALAQAHAAGIVHRDIKPDNIYLAVSPDDDGYLVKLLDFGIAKVAFSDTPAHESTRTGALIGTPHYMSPEQARGLKTLDYRTDLYALGLVAHTLLTGKVAFNSESLTDLIVRICTMPLPSMLATAPWLPATMEAWFQRACAREPGDRFQSAPEMIDALRAAASGARATEGWSGHQVSAPMQSAPMQSAPMQSMPQRMSIPNPLAATALHGTPPPATATAAPLAQSIGETRPAGVPGSRTGLVVAVIALVIVVPLLAVGAFYARGRFASAPASATSPLASSIAPPAASAPPIASTPSAEPAASASATPSASSSARANLRPPTTPSATTQPAGPKTAPATTKIDLGY